jgi:DeoR family transcriptional regulator, aga operon transcriptional repressor
MRPNPVESTEQRQTRLQAILEAVVGTERVSVDDLSAAYGVSAATIRRDLMLLEKQGLLRRDHGGAIPVEPLFYEALAQDSSFQEQIKRQAVEKKRIGLAAAELIQDGETVAFSAGTTTTQVARSIPFQRRITVFTNGVNMAMELGRRANLTVVLTGGTMRGAWFSLVGPAAIEAAQRMIFDKLFLGVNGVSIEAGLTDFHVDEAAVNRVLIAQSRQRIIVADHTKLGVIATCVVSQLACIDLLITDDGADPEKIRALIGARVKVRQV